MATYIQLRAEPAWGAEFAPPNLDAFYRQLRAFYGLGAAAIGGKGDNNHLSGYHRSRRWIAESRYCTNRSYSVVLAGDKGGNENWLAALDATIPAQQLYATCHRLDAAVRVGRLPQVAQWFGTFDGKTVVGWSYGRPSSSDSSHLWHLHVSFYRTLADVDHTLLYEIITGTEDGSDDMVTVVEDKLHPGDFYATDGVTFHRYVLDGPTTPNGIGDVGWELSGKGGGPKLCTNTVIATAPHITILKMDIGRIVYVTEPAPPSGGYTEEQIRDIAEEEARDEIANTKVVTTLTPAGD